MQKNIGHHACSFTRKWSFTSRWALQYPQRKSHHVFNVCTVLIMHEIMRSKDVRAMLVNCNNIQRNPKPNVGCKKWYWFVRFYSLCKNHRNICCIVRWVTSQIKINWNVRLIILFMKSIYCNWFKHSFFLFLLDIDRTRSWFKVDIAKDMLNAKPYQQQYLAKACSGRWQNVFNQKKLVCPVINL